MDLDARARTALRRQQAKFSDEKADLEEQIETLRKDAARGGVSASAMGSAMDIRENERLQKEVEQLKRMNRNLVTADSGDDRLKIDLQEKNSLIRQHERDIASLRQQLQSMEMESEQLRRQREDRPTVSPLTQLNIIDPNAASAEDRFVHELEARERQIMKLTEENERYLEALDQNGIVVKDFEHQMNRYQSDLAARQRTQITSTTQELTSKNDQIEELQARVASLDAEKRQFQQEVNNLRREAIALQSTQMRDRFVIDPNADPRQRKEFEDMLDEMHGKCEGAQMDVKILEAKLQDAVKSRDETDQQKHELLTNHIRLTREFEQLQQTCELQKSGGGSNITAAENFELHQQINNLQVDSKIV